MFKVRLSEELVDKIVADYAAGGNASEVARRHNVSNITVYKYLKERGVEKHTAEHITRRAHGCVLNDYAFDGLDEETAYWAGFLAADGCVRGRLVELQLKSSDITHLEKLKKFVSGNQKITIRTNNSPVYKKPTVGAAYRFSSERITKRLAEFGITERKSLTFKATELVAKNKHFIRGVIDGDGSLYITKSYMKRGKEQAEHPMLYLVGSRDFCGQFASYVSSILEKEIKVYKKNSVYVVSLGCTPAYRMIKHLYEDASVYLDRKKELADKIIRNFAYKYA